MGDEKRSYSEEVFHSSMSLLVGIKSATQPEKSILDG
jgi:hypothetical protein